MMSSNLLSRLLPSATGNPSIYEAIKEHEQAIEESDTECQDGATIDEQNLGERFQDQDLDELLAEAAESHITTESTAFLGQQRALRSEPPSPRRNRGRPKWMGGHQGHDSQSDEDDEVPESLLLEGRRDAGPIRLRGNQLPGPSNQRLPSPVPGPSSRKSRIQWDNTRAARRLSERDGRQNRAAKIQGGSALLLADPQQKAMWRWANVENLDNFLNDVYDYYLGKGIWSITLARLLYLLTTAFVGVFLSFLTICVDYRLIPESRMLSQVVIPQCTKSMSGLTNALIWVASFFWIVKLFQFILDLRRLRNLRDFYIHLLGIPDEEMQTISWQTIVSRLMNLRNLNPRTALNVTPRARKFVGEQSKQRMDAHDIANRLMRKENYLIALFNKEVLDLTLRIPFLGSRQLFSKTLEWNINFCVMDLVFNERGQVRQLFLKDTHRQELIETLRGRFLFAGFMNVLCAPFIVSYLLAIYFLRFFMEFQKNPSQLGARAYSPLAEWKFREFNELRHLFERRIDMSYPFASRYIDQFPKDKTVQVAKFVAFVTGALGGVLAVASLLDPELFLGFEITADRTVLFYLGILGTVWAISRGVVPEENLVFDPEFAIQNVVDFTHHRPAHWEGRLHSDDVRKEFAALYQPKVLIFSQEILSIIFTPFILWFSLPKCSERLIDFFREFTVHVDGLGYVCSFALFEFQKGGPEIVKAKAKRPIGEEPDLRGDYYSTKDGKMLTSYFNFLDSYANNPRRGVHHDQQRLQFHPPPTFPGLSPLPAAIDASATIHYGSPGLQGNLPTSQPINQALAEPRGTATHASPSPSLLLDPRHQPSTPLQRRTSRQHGQSKPQMPVQEPVGDHEYEGAQTLQRSLRDLPPQPLVSESAILAQDSHLGESWRTTRAGVPGDVGAAGESEVEDEGEERQGGPAAGVLGLLYQFQKAQTEGRAGPGVGI